MNQRPNVIVAAACYEEEADRLDAIWNAAYEYLNSQLTYDEILKKHPTITRHQLFVRLQRVKRKAQQDE
jgi:hypothetical protein